MDFGESSIGREEQQEKFPLDGIAKMAWPTNRAVDFVQHALELPLGRMAMKSKPVTHAAEVVQHALLARSSP